MQVYLDGSEHHISIDDVYFYDYDFHDIVEKYFDELLDEMLKSHKDRFYIALLRRGIVVRSTEAMYEYKRFLDSISHELEELSKDETAKTMVGEISAELELLRRILLEGVEQNINVVKILDDIESKVSEIMFERGTKALVKFLAGLAVLMTGGAALHSSARRDS